MTAPAQADPGLSTGGMDPYAATRARTARDIAAGFLCAACGDRIGGLFGEPGMSNGNGTERVHQRCHPDYVPPTAEQVAADNAAQAAALQADWDREQAERDTYRRRLMAGTAARR